MKTSRIMVIAVAVLALAYVGAAATRNTGGTGDPGASLGQHVLTPPEGRVGETILYAPSEADDAALRAAIAAATGGTVDYYDARAGTPDVTLLQSYDCVYTWANYAFLDAIGFGNNLAGAVDAGTVVILGSFCTYTSGNSLGGQIMTSAYSPVFSPSGSNHFSSSNYAGDGTTSIYDGVTTFECTYRDFLTLQGTGVQDGSYQDGEIAHAYRSPDRKVIYSNGSGAVQLGCTGQWALLIANACQFGVPVELQSISIE
jgi:hypothetical protein